VVECHLAKVDVAGSNPVSRSTVVAKLGPSKAPGFLVFGHRAAVTFHHGTSTFRSSKHVTESALVQKPDLARVGECKSPPIGL
jgi:hypothetical protein